MRIYNKKGQALVEFALVTMILFIVFFAIIEICMMFYVNLTMQHAVREGTRYAITGRSDLGTDRRAALIQKIKDSSNGLYDKNVHVPKDPIISVLNPASITYTNYSGTPQSGDPGKAGDAIIVSMTYGWRLITPIMKPFFPSGIYTFKVTTTMKNESF